jgi:hypothetical protein
VADKQAVDAIVLTFTVHDIWKKGVLFFSLTSEQECMGIQAIFNISKSQIPNPGVMGCAVATTLVHSMTVWKCLSLIVFRRSFQERVERGVVVVGVLERT